MVIDRTSFFLALGGLVAGGAGGYFVGDRGLLNAQHAVGVTEQQPPLAAPTATPVAVSASPTMPPPPVCDDTVGTAGACPVPGYSSDEGEGCGALPTKRCQDFKQAMKPRVAEGAVACLNALPAAQRCDSNRMNLCGHVALMSACPEPEGAAVAGVVPPDELTTRCTSIAQGCNGTAFSPSMRECRATLAGLSTFGREQIASCMKTHCGDKGLVGCEAIVDTK
jgi:hypothetical protein